MIYYYSNSYKIWKTIFFNSRAFNKQEQDFVSDWDFFFLAFSHFTSVAPPGFKSKLLDWL